MKQNFRLVLAQFLLILGVVWMLPLISVNCASNTTISITNPPANDESLVSDLCKDINQTLKDEGYFIDDFISYSYDGLGDHDNNTGIINIKIKTAEYKDLEQLKKQKVMQITLDAIYNSDASTTSRNKIYNEVCSIDPSVSSLVRQLSNDVTADFAKAYASFKPFSGVVGWILGLISLGMFLLLAITIVWDIAFLSIPILQVWLIGNKNEKPKTVSLEAWDAVKMAEQTAGKDYTNPVSFYLGNKIKQIVAISICLLYLVSGEIYNVLAGFMDYFSGFLPN